MERCKTNVFEYDKLVRENVNNVCNKPHFRLFYSIMKQNGITLMFPFLDTRFVNTYIENNIYITSGLLKNVCYYFVTVYGNKINM